MKLIIIIIESIAKWKWIEYLNWKKKNCWIDEKKL